MTSFSFFFPDIERGLSNWIKEKPVDIFIYTFLFLYLT